MLSMDRIYLIKKLAADGLSTRAIAKKTGFNRETVMKYIKKKVAVPGPFRERRPSKLDAYLPCLKDLLQSDSAVTNRKLKLTSKRIHELVSTGKLTDELPPLDVSARTIERAVKEIRGELAVDNGSKHLKLLHAAGKAQVDFGEVTMLGPAGESRHFILVMSFAHSNFRLAHLLPAQNFECLAHGLTEMFKRIGRVPTTLRCDNMSTAVAKIIRRKDIDKGQCNHDATDHPRRVTENFLAFMAAYGFDAEFCNPASGNEKGSVENAVGWVRRNFFCPLRLFDGNYDALNDALSAFCLAEAQKPHYRRKPKTIEALFKEDMAAMKPLPDAEAADEVTHTWGRATVTEDCRVKVDTNEYQVNLQPGEKVIVKKFWNKLVFYTDRRKPVSEAVRLYDSHKDSIDWSVELKLLSQRPSAFNSSYLQAICPAEVRGYLKQLAAPKRSVLLRALLQRVRKTNSIVDELEMLRQAIRDYGNESVEVVAAGYRGAEDVLTDSIKPMENVSQALGDMKLEPRCYSDVFKQLEGRRHD